MFIDVGRAPLDRSASHCYILQWLLTGYGLVRSALTGGLNVILSRRVDSKVMQDLDEVLKDHFQTAIDVDFSVLHRL